MYKHKRTEHILIAAALVAAGVTGGVLGHLARTEHTVVPEAESPSIPRCLSDDFNDGSQPLCWTVTVEGTVLVINAHDDVVSGADPATVTVDTTAFSAPVVSNLQ